MKVQPKTKLKLYNICMIQLFSTCLDPCIYLEFYGLFMGCHWPSSALGYMENALLGNINCALCDMEGVLGDGGY